MSAPRVPVVELENGAGTARCPAKWPICNLCTRPLTSSGGWSTCDGCGRRWPVGEREPCPDPATVRIADTTGDEGLMCVSHAIRAVLEVTGARVVSDNKAERMRIEYGAKCAALGDAAIAIVGPADPEDA